MCKWLTMYLGSIKRTCTPEKFLISLRELLQAEANFYCQILLHLIYNMKSDNDSMIKGKSWILCYHLFFKFNNFSFETCSLMLRYMFALQNSWLWNTEKFRREMILKQLRLITRDDFHFSIRKWFNK